MKRLGIFVAAGAGVLLLSGTLAGEWGASADGGVAMTADTGAHELPAWHPPVPGWRQGHDSRQPALPEGHPSVPDHLVCPVTGAIGKPHGHAKETPAPVEGLYRI